MKKLTVAFGVIAILIIASALVFGSEQKFIRALDNPPKEPRVIKPDIPAEYDSLIKTFDEYWDALIKRDFEKAYNLESKEFRKTTGLELYKGKFGKDVSLKNVRALSVKKTNEKEVMVTGSMVIKVALGSSFQDTFKPLNDRWIKEGEMWRHVREPRKGES